LRYAGRGLRLPAFSCLIGTALGCLSLTGCAGFWDDISAGDFSAAFKAKPDPMVVIGDAKSTGDQRAKALRALREPKQFGGSDNDQETILQVLVLSAKTDVQPLCRLAAIKSLGHFKDPRAAAALIDAYYQATSFPSETATIVQCEALSALGETGNPSAVDLLVKVVREPQPAFETPEEEKQQSRDRRIAATRALGNFKQAKGAEALVYVLQTDKDVALHDRAQESLVAATGRHLPDDPKAWEEFLHSDEASKPPPPSNDVWGIHLVGWFDKDKK
jgi:HEAT repeat protein